MGQPIDAVISNVVAFVLKEEGGIGNAHDGAGITRFGQTPAWLSQWHLPQPKTPDEAGMNYRWWMEHVGLDQLCDVDDSLGLVVTDFAVNSGERVAFASLQRALGGLITDGVWGGKSAARLALAKNRQELAGEVLGGRLVLDLTLIQNHPDTYLRDAVGWGNRISLLIDCLARNKSV